MNAPVAIITANYGRFDLIRPQVAQDIEVDWICVTDDPDLEVPSPWQKIVVPIDDHPCMAAKRYKTNPWHLIDHQEIIWNDANMEVTAPTFAREALSSTRQGVAVWRHPRRDCIYDEAEASLGAEGQNGKYASLPIREQVAYYRAEGFPEHAGLFGCGTVAWKVDEKTRAIGESWFAECARWGFQDQLSFPVVCRRHMVAPGVFAHLQITGSGRGYLSNPWLRIHRHL